MGGNLCLDRPAQQRQGYNRSYDPVEYMEYKGTSCERCVGQVLLDEDTGNGNVDDDPDCYASQYADPNSLLSRGQGEPSDCRRRSDEERARYDSYQKVEHPSP